MGVPQTKNLRNLNSHPSFGSAMTLAEQSPSPPSAPPERIGILSLHALRRVLSGGRFKLVALILVIELVIFFGAITLPMSASEQNDLQSAGNALTSSIPQNPPLASVASLFSHNLLIALAEAIPGFGVFLFGLSIYFTGRFLEAFSLSQGVPPLLIGWALFFFPHTWIEFIAYAFAVGEGVELVRSAIQRRFQEQLRLVPMAMVVIAVLLVLAAAFETAVLQLGLLGLVSWIPFILGAVGVYFARRRLLRRFANSPVVPQAQV
jgi:hypothetical protein